jgi:hypothetical protein
MTRIRNSKLRIVIQETFKGYGKAINLLTSVRKAFSLQTDPGYFLVVLVVRGSASAFCKQALLSVILKKKLRTKKPKANFYNNTVPTIVFYLVKFLLRQIIDQNRMAEFVDPHLTHFYIAFMVISRSMRSLIRVVKMWDK